MGKVSVNKGLLIVLVAVSALSLVAVAFLLGRASGSAPPSGEPEGRPGGDRVVGRTGPGPRVAERPREEPTPKGTPATDAASLPPDAMALPSAVVRRAGTKAVPGPEPPPTGTPASRGGSAADPTRAAVAAYLDAVDNIQPGRMSGGAEGLAAEMAAALAKGDTSSLDGMIRQVGEAKDRLAAVVPPAPCAAHHVESLGSLDDAAEMLRSLKKSVESPDPAAELAGVATRAAAIRSRSEALQREEEALRRRYGLTR